MQQPQRIYCWLVTLYSSPYETQEGYKKSDIMLVVIRKCSDLIQLCIQRLKNLVRNRDIQPILNTEPIHLVAGGSDNLISGFSTVLPVELPSVDTSKVVESMIVLGPEDMRHCHRIETKIAQINAIFE